MKRRNLRILPTLFAGSLLFSFAGCSDDDKGTDPPPPEPTGTVSIDLAHVCGQIELARGQMDYENSFGQDFQVDHLVYLLSNVRVINGDESAELGSPHYVDAFREDTHTITLTDVPADHWMSLAFTFGLDEQQNVAGTLNDNPDIAGFAWPPALGGGYHYMQLEGKFMDGEKTTPFFTHTGRSNDVHNHFEVVIEFHRNVVENQTLDLTLTMDLLQWYRSPNLIDMNSHAESIMPKPEEQMTVKENGGETNGTKLFSVEAG